MMRHTISTLPFTAALVVAMQEFGSSGGNTLALLGCSGLKLTMLQEGERTAAATVPPISSKWGVARTLVPEKAPGNKLMSVLSEAHQQNGIDEILIAGKGRNYDIARDIETPGQLYINSNETVRPLDKRTKDVLAQVKKRRESKQRENARLAEEEALRAEEEARLAEEKDRLAAEEALRAEEEARLAEEKDRLAAEEALRAEHVAGTDFISLPASPAASPQGQGEGGAPGSDTVPLSKASAVLNKKVRVSNSKPLLAGVKRMDIFLVFVVLVMIFICALAAGQNFTKGKVLHWFNNGEGVDR